SRPSERRSAKVFVLISVIGDPRVRDEFITFQERRQVGPDRGWSYGGTGRTLALVMPHYRFKKAPGFSGTIGPLERFGASAAAGSKIAAQIGGFEQASERGAEFGDAARIH